MSELGLAAWMQRYNEERTAAWGIIAMIDSTDRFIEENPARPGPAGARLRDSGVDVWILIAQLPAFDGDVSRLAAAYEIPEDALQAALAHYRCHKQLIDAVIAINAA